MNDDIDMEIDEPDVADAPARASVPLVPRKKDVTPRIDPTKTDDALATIRQKYARERELRIKSDAERDEARREAEEANYISIKASEESVKTKIADLRARIAKAKRDGDIDVEMDLNDELVDARVALRDLSRGREHLESTREAEPTKTTREPEPIDPDTLSDEDRMEHALSRYTPRTARWLREHPEFVTDEKKVLRAQSAHLAAIADDLKPDTDEYFDYVEKRLGIRNEPEDDDVAEGDDLDEGTIIDTPPPAAPRTNVAAPADDRRAPKRYGDMGNRRFRLPKMAVDYCNRNGLDPGRFATSIQGMSEAQLVTAIRTGVDPVDYNKQLRILKKEGRL